MEIEERNKRLKGYSRFRLIFDAAMGFFYLAAGLGLIFSKQLVKNLNVAQSFLWIFGGMLVIYGIFRIIRGIRQLL